MYTFSQTAEQIFADQIIADNGIANYRSVLTKDCHKIGTNSLLALHVSINAWD